MKIKDKEEVQDNLDLRPQDRKINPLVLLVALTTVTFTGLLLDRANAEPLQDDDDHLRQIVLYHDGTERPWSSTLNHETRDGWYVDVVTGDRLFRSEHKYESGTGWPSFYEVEPNAITLKSELFPWRGTEVRSFDGERHYGHVFKDGPNPTGLRYCMNGVALKFIPDEEEH